MATDLIIYGLGILTGILLAVGIAVMAELKEW